MTKLTLQQDALKVIVEAQENNITISDLLPLFEQLLLGAGYKFSNNMHLDLVEDDSNEKLS